MQKAGINGLVIRGDRDHGNLVFTKDAGGDCYAGDGNGNVVSSCKEGGGARIFTGFIDDANNMDKMPEGGKLSSPGLLCMMTRNMLLGGYIGSMDGDGTIRVGIYGKNGHIPCPMRISNMAMILGYGPFNPSGIALKDVGYTITAGAIGKGLDDWYGINDLSKLFKPYEYGNQ